VSFPHSAALPPLSFRPKRGICFVAGTICAAGDKQIAQPLNAVSE
jgi:hypothetical protein